MKKLRIAFIGMQHIHVGNISRDFEKHLDEVEIIGISDYPPYLEEGYDINVILNLNEKTTLKVWDNYRELLAQNIDIAVITTDVKAHVDACKEILAMGINVIVEKPMAISMEDAKIMYEAAKSSNAELIINWPVAWFPSFRKAKELSDSGIIGNILRVHYRSPSTRGPFRLDEYSADELAKLWWYKKERGGGSICDYAGYGCVLTTWFANKTAKRVSGFKQNVFLPFSDVEDYSAFMIDFDGTIGVVEGSWSTMNNGEIPTGPVVYGTEGVIVADRYNPDVKIYKDLKPYQPSPTPNEVYKTEMATETLASNVINHYIKGTPLFEIITLDFNMKAMAAFDAGMRSCDSGKIEDAFAPFGL